MSFAEVCLRVGFGMIAAGLVWSYTAGPRHDPQYNPRLRDPWFKKEHWQRRPLLYIDEAHGNSHTIDAGFYPLALLARADGYTVRANRRAITARGLKGVAVLAIADGGGYSVEEIAAIQEWVRAGGGLLLTAEAAGVAGLAAAFGVTLAEPVPGRTLFSRKNGFLAEHTVTESVTNATSFSGRILRPEGATVNVLRVDGNRSQGVLAESGAGRVGIFGDAALFTVEAAGIGIDESQNDNQQFALNVLHWLTRR